MKNQDPSLPIAPELPQSQEQIQELIRQRAYELYELHGRENGHDFDDWVAAESEVTQDSGTQRTAT